MVYLINFHQIIFQILATIFFVTYALGVELLLTYLMRHIYLMHELNHITFMYIITISCMK